MGLDISKITNAELKKLAFVNDKNNDGKLENEELNLFKAEAAAKDNITAEDFNQAMGLYTSNPTKAEKEAPARKNNNVSKEDLRSHENSIKRTLKQLADNKVVFTSEKDIANALREKFTNSEYDVLHEQIDQVLNAIPNFKNKDDVNNIKKVVKNKLKMNEFQKDVLNEIVKMAKTVAIQNELNIAIGLYEAEKAKYTDGNINYKESYKNAKEQIAKGSYADEVKELLKEHVKADADNRVSAKAVANENAITDKTMRKEIKADVDKNDRFMKKAIKNNEFIDDAVRRNKLNQRDAQLKEITAKELKDELGYDLYQKLNQSYLPANEKDGNFNVSTLADPIRKRIGSNVLIHESKDIPMSELNLIKKDLEVMVKDTLTDKEVKAIIDLVWAEVAKKDRSMGTALRNGVDGILPGLAGALSASRILDVKQNVSITTGAKECEGILAELAEQGIKPEVLELADGQLQINIKQEVLLNPLAINALIGAGVGFASRVLATLIFGEKEYEKSCVSIADFDPQDPQYTNLDNYKQYLQERLPAAKANALIAIAENCKDANGEFDKAQFDSLMKHIAGVGSVIACDEIGAHSKGITAARKAEEVTEVAEEETPDEPVQDRITTSQMEKTLTGKELVPTIDGTKTSWSKIANQYECLVERYGNISKAIRALKIAQAITDGDYSAERIDELVALSYKGASKLKGIAGLDHDVYVNTLMATYLGKDVKVPNELAGCKRNPDKSLETQALPQATVVVKPNGSAMDATTVRTKVTVYGIRVNGGAIETFYDLNKANTRLDELETQYPNAKIEVLEWKEFVKEEKEEV